MQNRQSVEIVNNVDRYNKLVENIDLYNAVEFGDNLVGVNKVGANVKLDKFNYIGFIILEKAKLSMYKAIYDYCEKEFDFSYHYTGTDSKFTKINVPEGGTIDEEMDEMT